MKEKSGRDVASTSESEEMMDIRKDFVAIHGQMLLLQNYSSLNFAGKVDISLSRSMSNLLIKGPCDSTILPF